MLITNHQLCPCQFQFINVFIEYTFKNLSNWILFLRINYLVLEIHTYDFKSFDNNPPTFPSPTMDVQSTNFSIHNYKLTINWNSTKLGKECKMLKLVEVACTSQFNRRKESSVNILYMYHDTLRVFLFSLWVVCPTDMIFGSSLGTFLRHTMNIFSHVLYLLFCNTRQS